MKNAYKEGHMILKRITKKTVAFLLSATLLSACGTQAFAVENTANMDDVKSAYQQKIQEYFDRAPEGYPVEGCRYGMAYIDADDIPDLILCYGTNSNCAPSIYLYHDGEIIESDTSGCQWGILNFEPKTGYVLGIQYGNGYYVYAGLDLFENGSQTETITFESIDKGANGQYNYNQEECSHDEYFRQMDQMLADHNFKHITYGELTGTDPSAFIDNFDSYIIEDPQDADLQDLYQNQ